VIGENRITRNDQGNEDHLDTACSTHGREDKCIKIVVGKPERTGSLERPRRI
jgi:hypothetical protein